MTSLKPEQEESFLKKRYERLRSEYLRQCINIDNLGYIPSSEELEKINEFNQMVRRELGL